jgi:hypothetical protein
MSQDYQNASPEDNDNRGPADADGCGGRDDVADNVAASTSRKSNDFNDVADVALRRGVYGEAGEEVGEVEVSSSNKTISNAKRAPDPKPPPAATPSGAELLDQMVKAEL